MAVDQHEKEALRSVANAYGGWISSRIGSAHEGTSQDQAEMILHELAHASLLGIPLRYGQCRQDFSRHTIDLRIRQASKRRKIIGDLHEVFATAVEMLTADSLGINLDESALLWSGTRNSRFDSFATEEQSGEDLFSEAVGRAIHTKRALDHSYHLLCFVRQETL